MIEILKQMQEALREYHYYTIGTGSPNQSMLNKGYTAYQAGLQAIAELESQEPVCPECKAEVLYECVACSRNNYPPQRTEQGEPVGYLEIDDIESQREYPHNCRNVNLWYESGEGLVAVYTHPPQRTWVGLTDEIPKGVLLAISNAGLTLLKTQHGYELRKLGPAVAHGIKE